MVNITRIRKNDSNTLKRVCLYSLVVLASILGMIVSVKVLTTDKHAEEFVSSLFYDDKHIEHSDKSPVSNVLSDDNHSTESTRDFQLAYTESLGFFNDISDEEWKRRKHRFQLTQPNYNLNVREREKHSRHSNWFWAGNFEPEFTCPEEFRLGKLGDGGKWVCDPHRIVPTSTSQCLVYSIGSNGNFDFEVEVMKHVSSTCEIHTFDIASSGHKKDFAKEAAKIDGVEFHNWGLGKNNAEMKNMKTFKEMFIALGHEKRTVDLMKIDCEKCEYEQFRQWLEDWKEMDMVVRQVMLEVHNSDSPVIMEIFAEFLKNGYVIFHKEANYLSSGNAVEVAFLLLSPTFQKENSTTIAN